MIRLDDVDLWRGARQILSRARLTLNPGEKIGLVGRNGAGKSSLMALLAGRLDEAAGRVERPQGWCVAEVVQSLPDGQEAAIVFVMAGDPQLVAAEAAREAAESAGDGEALAHAHGALEEAGVHTARARAQTLLAGLGFAAETLDWPVNRFSGGWRMRLQLARALMCPSDLLLLDEPTNHLDLDALVWLEDWLLHYPGMLIVISHDRAFLDAVTRVTVHLEDGTLTRYGGNYSAFETMRAERMAQQQAARVRQDAQVARLTAFITRFKAKATKARQAQSRVKALERMARFAPVRLDDDPGFGFDPPEALPNPMLVLRGLAVGYGGVPVLSGIDQTLLAGERIGILGANGQGKSTLIKTLVGELMPLSGEIVRGHGLAIGYFAQHELDLLRPDESPLQHLTRLAQTLRPAREQELRTFLGRFRIEGEAAVEPVAHRSGGEKARLVLALLVWQRPNLLLLDEPTNHLDLPTREALAFALGDYAGSVLVVSHDRALLESVCDRFWIVGEGRVRPFDDDLDAYQRELAEAARAYRQATRAPAAPRARPSQRGVDARLKSLRQKLARIEAGLQALEDERGELETRLAATQNPDEICALAAEIARVEAVREAQEAEWLDLADEIEAFEAGRAQAGSR